MTIDSKGKVKETYSYDAFGNAYEGSFLRNNDIGYNGKMFDPAVGLLNFGFRDYAPNLGRFTTVDPIRDGDNWYAYCGNDPVNFVDAWGLAEIYADDINGKPIIAYKGRDLKSETSITINRNARDSNYNDTISVNVGNQILFQSKIQSEADYPGYEQDTAPAGDYTGTFWPSSGHYEEPIHFYGNAYLIHPDQWTADDYVNASNNGPWSQPYSQGCQIMHLDDFNTMIDELHGIGFDYHDTIDIRINNDYSMDRTPCEA